MAMTEKAFSPEWMQARFRESGRRQKDLVSFLRERGLDVDATKINRSTKGGREVQAKEMPHVWEFFGLNPGDLAAAMSEASQESAPSRRPPPMPNAGLPERLPLSREVMPILGVSVGGDGRTRALFNGQVLGTVSRPASLADNPRAYAAYVHGNSMEPRYEAGEIVLVNPDKPVRAGNYVVAQVYDNDGDPPFGYIKKFISFGSELVLEQLNPEDGEDAQLRFPKARVLTVHRIVGTLDE